MQEVETSLGRLLVSWSTEGLREVRFEAGADAGEGGGKSAPRSARAPRWVREAVERLSRHLAGQPQDFSALPVDWSGVPPFHRKVYAAARRVRAGEVATYAELARQVGSQRAARAVGQAMARNPLLIVVPCHRVVGSGERLGGFSAPGGIATKRQLLELEGVRYGATRGEDRKRSLFGAGRQAPRGGLEFDSDEACARLREVEPALARVMDLAGPMRLTIQPLQSPFEALAEAIIYQQLSMKAASTIYGRLCAVAGGRRTLRPAGVLEASLEELRSAGVSRSKALSLRDLAERAARGEVPTLGRLRTMTDEAIIEALDPVRGVGRWTVEMLLIFRLGRSDVLPADDLGIQRGFQRAFKRQRPPQPEEVLARGERWRPFRTAASWYLWRAADQGLEAKSQ